MTNDIDWKYQIECLTGWLHSKGYTIVESGGARDSIVFDDKEVLLNSQYKDENKFYTLLHECGHLITNLNKKPFLEKYPLYPSDVIDGRVMKSISYRVSLVSEELIAWEKGLALAKRLNLKVDTKNYHKCMTDSIWTYIKYITQDT